MFCFKIQPSMKTLRMTHFRLLCPSSCGRLGSLSCATERTFFHCGVHWSVSIVYLSVNLPVYLKSLIHMMTGAGSQNCGSTEKAEVHCSTSASNGSQSCGAWGYPGAQSLLGCNLDFSTCNCNQLTNSFTWDSLSLDHSNVPLFTCLHFTCLREVTYGRYAEPARPSINSNLLTKDRGSQIEGGGCIPHVFQPFCQRKIKVPRTSGQTTPVLPTPSLLLPELQK